MQDSIYSDFKRLRDGLRFITIYWILVEIRKLVVQVMVDAVTKIWGHFLIYTIMVFYLNSVFKYITKIIINV